MRTNWISPCVPVLVSFLAPFFRHAGRGVVVAVVIWRLLVACVLSRACPSSVVRLSRAVVASPCLACFVSLVRSFLRCLRRVCLLSVPYPIVVSLGSPFVRQVGRGVRGRFVAWSWFASVAAACCLPWALYRVGVVLSCRPSSLLARGSSSLRLVAFLLSPTVLPCVVPVACFAPSPSCGRHGLIVVGCRRRGSWLVVGRRCSSSYLLALGCRRRACSSRRSCCRSCRCSSSRLVLLVGRRSDLLLVFSPVLRVPLLGVRPVVPLVPRYGSSRPVPVVLACFPVSVIMRGRCGC